MSINVFVVVMFPSASEKIVSGMVSNGWTVKQIPTPGGDGVNDLVETHPDAFASIVQFVLDNEPSDEQITQAREELQQILDSNDLKYYALFVGDMGRVTWDLGNIRKPSNVIPLGPYRS